MSDPKTITEALTQLLPGQKTVFDILKDPGIAATNVSMRLVKEPPPLAITPRRAHEFTAIDGFVLYLKAVAPKAVVLCNALTGRCQAVLDESAKNGVEVVGFTPQLHPTFAAWNAMLGQRMAIMNLAEFIQKQRRTIADGPALAGLLRQIKASTKAELQQGRGNGAVNGLIVTTKIQGKEADKDVDLPEVIVATMPLFVDSEHPATLEFDLLLEGTGSGAGVVATLTAPTLDTVRFEELKEYAAKLSDFQFGFGSVGHADWKFIA